MVQSASRAVRVAGVVAAALVAVAATLLTAPPASAHGGPTDPPTRTYVCRYLQPDAPPCRDAWATEPQALYDWMEVNRGDAAGRHRELVPDGRLCSAGRDKYRAFDAARADWPASPVAPGPRTFRYTQTAPHATAYFRYYLTRAGWTPTQPLRWDDLELLVDTGPGPAEAESRVAVTLPPRTGRHVLYVVWQRSDSPEAFYTCSDLDFGGGPSTGPTTTVPTTGPTTTTTTTPPAGPTGAQLALRTTDDWFTGRCVEGTVTNPTGRAVDWAFTFDPGGRVTAAWNGVLAPAVGGVRATGAFWNAELAPGARTTFGYCVDVTAPPGPPPTTTAPPPATVPTTVPPTTVPPTTVPPTTVPPTTVPPTTVPPTTGPPTTVPTTVPPTTVPVTAPSTTTAPGPAPSPAVVATSTTWTDWGSGRCVGVQVTNRGTATVTWSVELPERDRITSLWNGRWSPTAGGIRVVGEHWNPTLRPGASTSFGYCADR